MSATDPANIRAGLAANIVAVITNAQCNGYLLSDPTPPCFEIEPAGTQYDQAMARGVDEQTWTVRGLVGTGSDLGAQKKLDSWLISGGTVSSIKAAIETDRTLGGYAHTLHVTEVSAPRTYTVASQPNVTYLGAEWTVRVLTDGN